MTKATQEAIKKEIGYTETPSPECCACVHVILHVIAGEYHCRIAGEVGDFLVKPHARCEHFKRRTP